jgi:dTDP-4-dehydrorhamnose reductase
MIILVTGAGGQVGRELIELDTDHDMIGFDRAGLDVADLDAVQAKLHEIEPDAVVHCAAWTAVDACESDPEKAYLVNATGTRNVMRAARSVGAYVAAVSTDYVFDGAKATPYDEDDIPNPQSVYGRSKLAGEESIDPTSAIVRTSWVCGRYGANMVKTILRLAGEHDKLSFVADQRGHPTIASDLARMIVTIVEHRLEGIVHATNQGAVSWYEFAQAVLEANGDDPSRVLPITTAEMPRPAPRPANSVLDNRRLRQAGIPLLPDFRESLRRLVADLTGRR